MDINTSKKITLYRFIYLFSLLLYPNSFIGLYIKLLMLANNYSIFLFSINLLILNDI